MLRKTFFLALLAIVAALGMSSKAQAWRAYHAGYTHYGPVTGFHHYGYTSVHTGGYGYGGGGYHYGGYHYGGGGYHYGTGYGGGYHYGYYRRW